MKFTKSSLYPVKSVYRSGAEYEFSKVLKKHNIAFTYESQTLIYVPPMKLRKYYPDFTIKNEHTGNFVHLEFKGYFTAADRKKLLAVKKDNLFEDIRLVFQKDNWLTKAKKQRYSEWAKDHGFECHVGISLPKEWINEFTGKK